MICAVCQALAYDPVQANCCGNVYCTQCIERWKSRSNSCPTCRSTEQSERPFNVFKDRNAHRHISSLTVYCPNQTDGCSKMMDLSGIEKHLSSDNGCSFHIVEYSNKCEHKERRATVKKHMTNECRLRRKKCKYCPLISTHEEVTGAHLLSTAPTNVVLKVSPAALSPPTVSCVDCSEWSANTSDLAAL